MSNVEIDNQYLLVNNEQETQNEKNNELNGKNESNN